jgi:hypothetical protein
MNPRDFDISQWLRERIDMLRLAYYSNGNTDLAMTYSPDCFLESLLVLCPNCALGLRPPDGLTLPFHAHRRKAFTVTCEGCSHVSTGVFLQMTIEEFSAELKAKIAEMERRLYAELDESARVWVAELGAAYKAGPAAVVAMRRRDQAREIAWLQSLMEPKP